ncbi:MAG TPA: anhydro-N-acetylmuramic acid kinase [Gemmatales bacterium]|nr:anhydro-N-acetylmuramic acid kinase [Gemmatales bacterium]HMP58014.1 anhydro-N-acetylmuramic acid kinase [Gemmatales bacterium]
MLTRHVLGLALHPALEQVQAAVLLIEGLGLDLRAELVQFHQESIPDDVQTLLVGLVSGGALEARHLTTGHRALSEMLAAAALHALDRAGMSLANVLCLGLDNLVLCHDGEAPVPTQLTLGAAGLVAERTGVTVVGDFAGRDLASHGQGMSLAALPHFLLFRAPEKDRAVLSIREWSEATLLPRTAEVDRIRGGLAGPGTWLLDSLVQQMTGGQSRSDPQGRHAVQGRLLPALLERWLHHPLVMKRWPRSAPRSTFGVEFARQTILLAQQQGWTAHDVLCTSHHFVAVAAVQSLRQAAGREADRGREVVLCGAGSRNGFLWRLLEELEPGWRFVRSDDLGWPAAAVQAAVAALLAALALDGEPANLPAVTGARGARLLGHFTPGALANWSSCLDWMTGRWEFAYRRAG